MYQKELPLKLKPKSIDNFIPVIDCVCGTKNVALYSYNRNGISIWYCPNCSYVSKESEYRGYISLKEMEELDEI